MGTAGILVAAVVGALAGLTVGPAADAIATRRYGPDSDGHDPDDLALALVDAPTTARARIVAAAVTTAAVTLLAVEFADVEVWLFFTLLAWAYAVASLIDLQFLRLPDVLTYPAAGFAFVGSFVLSARIVDEVDAAVPGAIAAIAMSGFLWIVAELYRLIRRVEAFGLGDVKLQLSLGASVGWLGWSADSGAFGPIALVVWAMMTGLLLGSLGGLPAAGFKLRKHVPFGPALMLGWLVVVLLADSLRP